MYNMIYKNSEKQLSRQIHVVSDSVDTVIENAAAAENNFGFDSQSRGGHVKPASNSDTESQLENGNTEPMLPWESTSDKEPTFTEISE